MNQEPSSSNLTVRRHSDDEAKRIDRPAVPHGSSERSLSRTAFEVDSQDEFWRFYYPRDDAQTLYVGGIYTAPWIRTLRDIAAFDATSRVALQAISLNVVGRTRSYIDGQKGTLSHVFVKLCLAVTKMPFCSTFLVVLDLC